MTLTCLYIINVCLNSRDCLISVQLNVRKFTSKHHGRREVIFLNQEYFWTNSEMTSTGGDYLLFAISNGIHLLNASIGAIIDVLQSTNIQHRLWTLMCSSETVKDQFSVWESVHLNECWNFHYKFPWVWDLNISNVSNSPPAHLLLC